jgi:hypothetical protein
MASAEASETRNTERELRISSCGFESFASTSLFTNEIPSENFNSIEKKIF